VKTVMRCVHVQRSSNILRGRDGIEKSGTCIQTLRRNVLSLTSEKNRNVGTNLLDNALSLPRKPLHDPYGPGNVNLV
jgi:hypothetical protein